MKLALAAVAGLLLTACGGGSPASPAATSSAAPVDGTAAVTGDVTVFAAASLTDAFNQIKSDVEAASPGARLTMSFAGSPTLRNQLSQGARADVFASADIPNMQGAQSDRSIEGQPSIFAHNKVTVVVPAQDARIQSLQDLAKPGAKVVIEQDAVPAGAYSRQALAKMDQDPAYGAGFSAKVLANVVSQEPDVRSVLSRIQLGEADAGMLYVSDVGTPSVRGQVKTIAIPDQFNIIADYPMAVVKNAPNPAGARAFIDYVLSPSGQRVLENYGLAPARP